MVRFPASLALAAGIVSILTVVSPDSHGQWNGNNYYRSRHGYEKHDRTGLHLKHV